MRWELRYQLLTPPLLLLLGVVAITTWTAVASANRAWQQLETRVRGVGRIVSEDKFRLVANVLHMMKGLSEAEYEMDSATGERYTTFPRPLTRLPPPEAVADTWQTLHLGDRLTVDDQEYLCSGLRLRTHSGEALGVLYILYPESVWRDALWEAIQPSLIVGGSVGLAAVLVAVGVGQRLTRRIQELERRTRQIAAGDFSPMRLPRRRDEIRDLAVSVNDMAERLVQLQEAVKKAERLRLLGQVSGGLAHQMRNGITGARLAVQLHLRECRGSDPETLEVALRQLTLVGVHLKRFLDLGRGERLKRERCSIGSLLSEVVELLRPQCRHGRIELRWRSPEVEAAVMGDAGQLTQLFLNVIGNAVEAAGPGGWVEVSLVSGNAQTVVVEVRDSGDGPPSDLAAKLFEPFVTSKPEGVGLGLAVARQVVEGHGGKITWSREQDQTLFRIELPREMAS
jgi:signal transduction histidine kinase